MKTFLITGAAGLLGGRMAEYILRETPHNVILVDNLSGGHYSNIQSVITGIEPSRFKYSKVDVLNTKFMEHLFQTNTIDYVFHFAAYAAEGLSPFIRVFNYENNLGATANIVNLCIKYGVTRLVFTSSMAVYGNQEPPFHEDMVPQPIDPYGVAKFACEMDIQIAGEQHGLDWCIIRPHNCYSDDTEILTDSGWKYFKDLVGDDSVMTLNPETKNMEFHVPYEFHKYDYSGELVEFTSSKLLVTPDHPMVYTVGRSDNIKKIKASDLLEAKSSYSWNNLHGGYNWAGVEKEYHTIPAINDSLGRNMENSQQRGGEKIIDMSVWCEFIGWFISEGSAFKTPSNYTVCISQNKGVNSENYLRIIQCVEAMGFHAHQTPTSILINSKQLYTHIKNIFGNTIAKTKFIPRELLSLSPKNLTILHDAMMLGDGDKSGDRYSTASLQLANDFQELRARMGCRIPKITSEISSTGNIIYRLTNFSYKHSKFGDQRTKENCVKMVPYEGMVYDVTVKNHIILVRRNGVVTWGSNCYGRFQNIWDSYRNFIGIAIYKSIVGDPITIYGDGLQTRAFSEMTDSILPLLRAATEPKASKQIINLGGTEESTILDAANIVKELMGGSVIHLPPRHEVKHAHSSWEKSVDILGFEHKTNLYTGIKEMVEWAIQQPSRPRFIWDQYEITNGLYSYWKPEALKDGYYKTSN